MSKSINTSRHSGLLALLDFHLVHPGHLAPEFSAIAHQLFNDRLESDYREFIEIAADQAGAAVANAERFCALLDTLR